MSNLPNELQSELNIIYKLKDCWNGDFSLAPNQKTIDYVEKVLSLIDFKTTMNPILEVGDLGEITIAWESNKWKSKRVLVFFDSDENNITVSFCTDKQTTNVEREKYTFDNKVETIVNRLVLLLKRNW